MGTICLISIACHRDESCSFVLMSTDQCQCMCVILQPFGRNHAVNLQGPLVPDLHRTSDMP